MTQFSSRKTMEKGILDNKIAHCGKPTCIFYENRVYTLVYDINVEGVFRDLEI